MSRYRLKGYVPSQRALCDLGIGEMGKWSTGEMERWSVGEMEHWEEKYEVGSGMWEV
jgi:hypothetical protein